MGVEIIPLSHDAPLPHHPIGGQLPYGRSPSAYGPEETFRRLGEHRGLAVFLAHAMIAGA